MQKDIFSVFQTLSGHWKLLFNLTLTSCLSAFSVLYRVLLPLIDVLCSLFKYHQNVVLFCCYVSALKCSKGLMFVAYKSLQLSQFSNSFLVGLNVNSCKPDSQRVMNASLKVRAHLKIPTVESKTFSTAAGLLWSISILLATSMHSRFTFFGL